MGLGKSNGKKRAGLFTKWLTEMLLRADLTYAWTQVPLHAYRQSYDTRSLSAVELLLFGNRVFLKSTPAILVFEAVDHLRNRVLHVGDVCGLVVDVGLFELDLEFGDDAIYLCSPGVEVGEVSGVCIL